MQSLLRSITRCLGMPWAFRNTPNQLALGMTLGFALGLIPKDNLIAVGLALGLLYAPANMGCAAIAFCLAQLSMLKLDPLAHSLGESSLRSPAMHSMWLWYCHQPVLPWLGLHNTIVLGSLGILSVLSPTQFVLARAFFRWMSRSRMQRQVDMAVEATQRYKQTLLSLRHQASIEDSSNLKSLTLEQPIEEQVLLNDIAAIASDLTSSPSALDDSPSVRDIATHFGEQQIRVDGQQHSQPLPLGMGSQEGNRASVLIGGANDKQSVAANQAPPSASQQLRPGLRIDHAEPSEEFPAIDTAASSSSASMTQSSIPSSLQLGDILRETLIEVVRFRPHTQNALHEPAQPSLGSSDGISGTAAPLSQHPSATTSLITESQSTMQVTSRSTSPNNASRHDANSTSTIPSTDETRKNEPVPQPAEESLRYLLWHLSSLNRETKQ